MSSSDIIQYLNKAEGSLLKISREEVRKALKRLGFERFVKEAIAISPTLSRANT